MKKKFFMTTTVAQTLSFFRGQPRLWKEEFEVTAIAGEREKLEAFAEGEGIGYKYMPMHRDISVWSDWCCLVRWIWLLLKERPYIVHGNTPKASLLSMVAAWVTRRPVRIYMCHGLRYQGTQGRLRKVLMTMEKISCSCATQVLSVSHGTARVLVADGLCKAEKVKVVGYGSAGGIDMERFYPDAVGGDDIRGELGIERGYIVFSFVGRIVKDKGINELVRAFARLNQERGDCHLILVGGEEKELNPIDDTTRREIERNVHIHAVGRQADVRPYLNASDVFVLPSYREGFGMVLIEAGAIGLPCITTNITGCNEIIVPGENGALVDARSEEALYEEMKKWSENPDDVRKKAGNARRMVEERYECKKVWNLYFEEYKKLAGVSEI